MRWGWGLVLLPWERRETALLTSSLEIQWTLPQRLGVLIALLSSLLLKFFPPGMWARACLPNVPATAYTLAALSCDFSPAPVPCLHLSLPLPIPSGLLEVQPYKGCKLHTRKSLGLERGLQSLDCLSWGSEWLSDGTLSLSVKWGWQLWGRLNIRAMAEKWKAWSWNETDTPLHPGSTAVCVTRGWSIFWASGSSATWRGWQLHPSYPDVAC